MNALIKDSSTGVSSRQFARVQEAAGITPDQLRQAV